MSLPERRFDEQTILLALLKLIYGGWISPSQFDRMAKDFGIPEGGPSIYFMTGLMHIVRELPFKVFDDDAARSALLEALQSALDAAIAREEAADPVDPSPPAIAGPSSPSP